MDGLPLNVRRCWFEGRPGAITCFQIVISAQSLDLSELSIASDRAARLKKQQPATRRVARRLLGSNGMELELWHDEWRCTVAVSHVDVDQWPRSSNTTADCPPS